MGKKLQLKYRKFTLKNGITCIAFRRQNIHSVTINVGVKVGSLIENPSNNGISHFLEHLVFNGTKQFPTYKDLDGFINSISGDGNAYTTIDKTVFYGTFPYQYLAGALKYYSEIVFNPRLTQKSINKEKKIILDELKRDRDIVENNLHNNIVENRFETKKTSFSFDIIGPRKNIEGFSRKQLVNFYKQFYVPQNTDIVIAGNFKLSSLKEELNRHFGGIKTSKKSSKSVIDLKYPKYSKFKIAAKQRLETDQCYLTLTFPSFEPYFTDQRKRTILSLLNDSIASAQFQQSVLWKVLREELGLVYGVSAWTYNMGTRSFNCLQTSFNPKYLSKVLKEMYTGIENFKMGKTSVDLLDTIKKQIKDTMRMEMDSVLSAVSWIQDQEKEKELNGQYLSPSMYLKTLNKIKQNDLIREAKQIFNWEYVNIGIISKYNKKVIENRVKKIWLGLIND